MKTSVVRRPSPSRQSRRRGPFSVALAVVIGLGGGLLLSGPLSELISTGSFGTSKAALNPFAGWTQGISQKDLLLLGTDVGGGNTDVIATLRVDGGVTRVTQIPRDTYIEAERYGPVKINALYAIGGTDAVKREISYHLGRPVSHHIIVNLSAIRRIADAVGGIEVDVPKRMSYVDNSQGLVIDLQPGVQNLKGRDLEGFLRFRHDEMGDIGRLERQRLALQALFRKITSPQLIVRLPSLLMATGNDIKTDMGPMELGGLVTAMGGTKLETRQLGGRPFDLNGISYWEVDWPTKDLPASSSGADVDDQDRYRFLF